MSITRFILGTFLTLVCAGVGVSFMALRITGKPREYISLAKVISAPPTTVASSTNPAALEDYYGTIIETLESAEIRRRALDRVRVLHPDMKESDVEIKVSRMKGASIFNIRAFGAEPKYTKIFLNAHLDEYIAFKSAMKAEDVKIVERASGAVEDLQDWSVPILTGGALGASAGLLLSLMLFSVIGGSSSESGKPSGKSFGG